jgi:signal peptidase I
MVLPVVLLLAVYVIYRTMIKSEDSNVRLLGNVIGGGMAVLSCLLVLFVRPMVLETDVITSDSMIPTLLVGDHVFADKLSYTHREPRHGEIVIFRFPSQEAGLVDDILIKRVIGVPGDSVQVKNGSVYRNGQRIGEPYIREPMQYELAEMTVPEGKLFVLGDNRNVSDDSHIWGFLDRRRLIGRVTIQFWPLKSMRSVH